MNLVFVYFFHAMKIGFIDSSGLFFEKHLKYCYPLQTALPVQPIISSMDGNILSHQFKEISLKSISSLTRYPNCESEQTFNTTTLKPTFPEWA